MLSTRMEAELAAIQQCCQYREYTRADTQLSSPSMG